MGRDRCRSVSIGGLEASSEGRTAREPRPCGTGKIGISGPVEGGLPPPLVTVQGVPRTPHRDGLNPGPPGITMVGRTIPELPSLLSVSDRPADPRPDAWARPALP